MCAIYTFMRVCDDRSDAPGEPAVKRQLLDEWGQQLTSALEGQLPLHPVWPAFTDTVKRFGIPGHYFHEMIDGVTSDIDRQRIQTFDELYRYCYQVASVAGIATIHVFRFRDAEALPLAEKCGVAFQLTNIIRDVKEDFQNGRVYLPQTEMSQYGVTEPDLAGATESESLQALLKFEAERAWSYYRESRPLLGMIDPSCRGSLWALIEIYSRLLARIERDRFPVLQRRVRISTLEKMWLLFRGLVMKWSS